MASIVAVLALGFYTWQLNSQIDSLTPQIAKGLAPAGDLTAKISQLSEMGPSFERNPPVLHTLANEPSIDNSDMTPAVWLKIAEDIKQHYDKYDGVVVLHGTDTLAYTSSALCCFIRRPAHQSSRAGGRWLRKRALALP